MYIALTILAVQTILFWLIVVILYRLKSKFTLIPLYAYLAILTLLTHNLSDLGFSIVAGDLFFLISSVSFFTTLMFTTLFLYLFEGPRAGRLALGVILGSSFFYILTTYLLSQQADTSGWVELTWSTAASYFWSLLAIIIDVFLLAILWELWSKIKKLNFLVKIFLVTLTVLVVDTFIFTTGVFGNSELYLSMLKGNLAVRLILSIIAAPLIALLLKSGGYAEEKRQKPKNFWEIFNFRSDLEARISSLEKTIKEKKELESQLESAKETYELVIAGSGAGIWDWDIAGQRLNFSPRFCQLLGFKPGSLTPDLSSFKRLFHPEDLNRTFELIDTCFKTGRPFETEFRLKNQDGSFRWFAATGITKYDADRRPIRIVGSIIDIDAKKQAEITVRKKIAELTKLNQIMIDREIKMVELKKEIEQLEK